MWENARKMIEPEQLAERSELLNQLGETMKAAASDLGLAGEGCHRVCKEQLEFVNGRLQRVLVCKIVCD